MQLPTIWESFVPLSMKEKPAPRSSVARDCRKELLRLVASGAADFKQVLVYDVSRWGRFPDSDEAAHYEFLCKQAGIAVHYCAEQFENDNSTTSNLLKALKRVMAGEYSRELSVKIGTAQHRLMAMGFWQGGSAPFGMLRQLVSETARENRYSNLESGRVAPQIGLC